MTLEQEMARGAQARAILEHDLFKEAVETVQKGILEAFASAEPADKDGLQLLRLRLKCLADVVRQIQTVMETGILAQEEAKRRQGIAEMAAQRLKRGIRAVF